VVKLTAGYPPYAPVRLPTEIAFLVVLLFITAYAVHWFRRAFREGSPTGPSRTVVDVPINRVKAYDLIQRLFHWTNFVVLGIMVLTGISIFLPGPFYPILSLFGMTSTGAVVATHTAFVWALLVLIIIHVVWDTAVARGWANIWVGKTDVIDLKKRAENFLGISKEYPREGKYDFFMKSFHWGLTVSLIALGITGIYFMNPLPSLVPIPNLGYETEYIFRLVHDFFAFLLVGLVIGHIYFAILPVNWPVLGEIVIGTISREFYQKHFDSTRWPLARSTGIKKAKPGSQEGNQDAG
jgi:cytochrome b subunit of formate dehydrogenase